MNVRVALALVVLVGAGCASKPSEPSPLPCSYDVTPLTFTPCMSPMQVTATLATGSGCTWRAAPTASWVTIDTLAWRSGAGTIGFAVAENYAPPREAAIQVQWPGTSQGLTIRIAQGGCLYTLIPESTTVLSAGADGSFDVWQMAQPIGCGGPTQDRCVIAARADATWVEVLSVVGGDPGRVRFRVAANDTSSSRSGTITVQSKVFVITQAGR